jgi:hypothetical protein
MKDSKVTIFVELNLTINLTPVKIGVRLLKEDLVKLAEEHIKEKELPSADIIFFGDPVIKVLTEI